eukprot:TRINITY_DN3306_c0_g2_i1.p1 TRINITY_DN3306_c0_g2~~TRINITY_DN3306_c0_g2_i1.p1  ORF type:complete len:355 (+),score=117.00 TRINITY_DN3306_c0_g2_i1:31-1095(+)
MSNAFDDLYNRAFGCIMGAAIGDSCGASLEFLGGKPTELQAKNALNCIGGGVHCTLPGQITDDTELALSLMDGLIEGKGDINHIAKAYTRWVQSQPFDIGNTCRSACLITHKLDIEENEGVEWGNLMTVSAAQCSMKSKANGALMRCTPLAIFGVNLNQNDLVELVKKESRLTHPNPACTASSVCYVLACRHLILNEKDSVGAFDAAYIWLLDQVENQGKQEYKEVLNWLDDAKNDKDIKCYPLAGFVKIAFTLAFKYLLRKEDFNDALYETMYGGGDTDTNAAIVGGLLGAFHGFDALPDTKDIVLNCTPNETITNLGRLRPDYLFSGRIPQLTKDLLSVSPETLENNNNNDE